MLCDGCGQDRVCQAVKRSYIGTPPRDWPRFRHYCGECMTGDPRLRFDPSWHFEGYGIPVEAAPFFVAAAVYMGVLMYLIILLCKGER